MRKTPFDALAATIAAHTDPLAKMREVIDPPYLREFRRQQELLESVNKLPAGIEEAHKSIAATEALGVNRATVEAILGYRPGDAVIDAALGRMPGGASMEAAAGLIPRTLKDEIDRATVALCKPDELYRSPARDVLEQIATNPDIKPTNRGRRVAAPAAPTPSAKTVQGAVPVASVADIGKRVREARLAMGMTQQRFADMAGVGRRFLIELEQGKPSLEIGRVLAVCKAAGIKIVLVA